MDSCCVKGSGAFNRLEELSQYLKIIAHSNRLQILCLLKKGERCVCDIHEPLGLPQNLTSHHLKALRKADLVIARREGKWIHYKLNIKKLNYLTKLYNNVVLGGFDGNKNPGTRVRQLQEAGGKCI